MEESIENGETPPPPPPKKKANKGSKITFNALHFVAFFISEHRNGVMQAILTFRSVNKVMMSDCVFFEYAFPVQESSGSTSVCLLLV